MKLLISLFLLFITVRSHFSQLLVSGSYLQEKDYLPVYISYYPEPQPDSIKMFFKNALLQRKIEVITKEKMQELVKQESERIFSFIRSNGNRSESILEQVEQLQEPVCNSVQINLQFNSGNKIDSIKWKTSILPINPQKKINREWSFVNIDSLKNLPFKKMIDAVVDSIIDSNKLK
jgi:hypothetical protein